MKLKMTIPSATTTSYVSAKELKKKSDGISDKGYFFGEVEWNHSDDPIVVTVKCTTYINETLTGTEKKDGARTSAFHRFHSPRGTDEEGHRGGPEGREGSADRGSRRLALLR
jgi:hypothetical protein